MTEIVYVLLYLSIPFEIISAGVLVYALATSKASSKTIIKTVLIGTVVYTLLLIMIPVVGVVMPFVVFPIIFCILGSQAGHKFNAVGFVSLIAYLISFFILPVISNKHEDSWGYQLAEGFGNELGIDFTPTQFRILTDFSGLSEYSDDIGNYFGIMFVMLAGVILFAILLFDMILLRKNTAQIIMGSTLSVFAAGMLYLDYRIFHSGSLGGKLAGMALSKMGFSLSPFCLLIMLFAILTVIAAYRCSKKEKESTYTR